MITKSLTLLTQRHPGFLHALVAQNVTTPVKVAAAPLFNSHVYRIIASIAAKSVAIISSQRINFAHSPLGSWNVQRTIHSTVVRRGFIKYQISVKLVTVNCLCFSLEGSYLSAVSVAHSNRSCKVIFLFKNCSHFAEFRNSLPTSFYAARTGHSHTLAFCFHEVSH